MRRLLTTLLAALALLLGGTVALAGGPHDPAAPEGLAAAVGTRAVQLSWQPAVVPAGLQDAAVVVSRDGSALVRLPATATGYDDNAVAPGERHAYTVALAGRQGRHAVASAPSRAVAVRLPAYLVGAATADITPAGVVNLGGYGLGDGRLFPDAVVSRGGRAAAQGERIRARAAVFDDGHAAVAIASIETQGYFAAYESGPYGITDMAAQVAKDLPRLRADHIIIASDHTHAGPDTIGAWGGVSDDYLRLIRDRTVQAIEQAYAARAFATVRAGHSDASDLIYNQGCTEALNQSKTPAYTGPDVCPVPGKDGMVRALQATRPDGQVVLTYMNFAAHATGGGAPGLHGDWPQFLSDALTAQYGGTGLAMVGALGGTQPCRTACAFTKPSNPGYDIQDRKAAYIANYGAHVADALAHSSPVAGPVAAAQSYLREPISGPAVLALFTAGGSAGAHLLRSHESPWVVGETIRTIASAIRVGDVLFAGTPGEGFNAIGAGVRSAVGAREVIPLGLANDQLGYLIAPVSYVPVIAAEAPVNDNIIFNVSPTIGDHVTCTDIRLALSLGFAGASPATCAAYDAADATGGVVDQVPVGGVSIS